MATSCPLGTDVFGTCTPSPLTPSMMSLDVSMLARSRLQPPQAKISVCGRCEFGWPGIGPDKQRSVRADWFGPSAGQAVVSGPVLERLRCGDGRLPLVSVPLLVKPRVLPRSPAACAARSCCVLQRGACPEICSFSSLLVSYSLFFPLSLSVSVSLSPFVPCSY